jgi:hypothetical protein
VKCAYIYYHIDPAQAGLAAAQVDALLATLAAHCSQPPRRLNRCDDPTTWLEIYEGIADFAAFASALGEATLDLNCAAFTRDERHLECFSTPAP